MGPEEMLEQLRELGYPDLPDSLLAPIMAALDINERMVPDSGGRAPPPDISLLLRHSKFAWVEDLAMEAWTHEQVLAWSDLALTDAALPTAGIAAMRKVLVADETQGDELEFMKPKRLEKLLRKAGVEPPTEDWVALMLRCRDKALHAQQHKASKDEL